MHTVIYFNQKPLAISTEVSEEIRRIQELPGCITVDDTGNIEVDDLVKQIQRPEVSGLVVLTAQTEKVLNAFKQKLVLIQAAGGCIHTDNNTVLLIFRKGKWDLPKGKLDEGEKLEDCAVREVEEETGLEKVELEKPLNVTHHTYYQDGQLIIKESHWYLMKSEEQKVLTPQTEEDILECKWVKLDELAPYLDNTHPSIIDVLRKALTELHAQKGF